MKTTLAVLAPVALTCSLVAQTYITSPPGFTTTANTGLGSYSITFGAYFDERSQIADGNYRGTPLLIKEVALRRDEQAIAAHNVIGKTWADFQFFVGDCDYNNLTNDWNKNFTNPPKQLISGSLNWPDATAQAPNPPEPWGDLLPTKGSCVTTGGKTVCTGLLFPFTTPHVYAGTADLLWEFQLFGGTLNNNQPWGNYNKSYYLDGTSNQATVGGGVSTPTPFSDPIMTSCKGPGTSTRVGYAFLRVVTYAVHNDPTLPTGSSDSFEVSYVVRDVRGVSGIVAISLTGTNDIGNPAAIYIGGKNAANEANVGCMPLGVDISKSILFPVAMTANATTSFESPRQYIKYNAAWAGLTPVYGQFAYDDPTTTPARFRLSGTGSSLIFDQPTLQPWKSKVIGDYGSGNRGPQPRSGTGPLPSTSAVPLLRYTL